MCAQRMPSVVVSAKVAASARSSASGSASIWTAASTRPFLPQAGHCTTSSTPGRARRRSRPRARSSGVWSSISKRSTATGSRIARPPAGANSRTRRTLLNPGKARPPKPAPTPTSVSGSRAGVWTGARWRRIAAPVGVTRSPSIPSSRVTKPRSRCAAAGAGTGSRPWALRTRPAPRGIGPHDQQAPPRASIRKAAATTSVIESQAPTSWKATSSGAVPCTAPSASASSAKIARARSRTPGARPAASSRSRMAASGT